MTNLDVLSYLDEIPVCVAYTLDSQTIPPLPRHPQPGPGEAGVRDAPRLENGHPRRHQ